MHCTQSLGLRPWDFEYNAYQPAGCNFNAPLGLMQQKYNDGTHFISSDPFCHLVVTKILREEAEVHDILKNVDFSLHITTHLVEERFTMLWPLVTFLLVLPRSRFHTYALPRRSRGWKWKKVASSTFSERMLQTHGLIVIWNYGIWTNLFERFDRRVIGTHILLSTFAFVAWRPFS